MPCGLTVELSGVRIILAVDMIAWGGMVQVEAVPL